MAFEVKTIFFTFFFFKATGFETLLYSFFEHHSHNIIHLPTAHFRRVLKRIEIDIKELFRKIRTTTP